jgi:hypothetical protein
MLKRLSQQSSFSILLQKPPSDLSVLSASVVNKNTALQSLKTHLVVVRIVGCCEVLWRARRETT